MWSHNSLRDYPGDDRYFIANYLQSGRNIWILQGQEEQVISREDDTGRNDVLVLHEICLWNKNIASWCANFIRPMIEGRAVIYSCCIIYITVRILHNNRYWNVSVTDHMMNIIMTSSNGNVFRVTGHLCGELTCPRWITHTKASDADLSCFLWSMSE